KRRRARSDDKRPEATTRAFAVTPGRFAHTAVSGEPCESVGGPQFSATLTDERKRDPLHAINFGDTSFGPPNTIVPLDVLPGLMSSRKLLESCRDIAASSSALYSLPLSSSSF